MKLKELFNVKNISSFIEGNAKYFYDQMVGLPQHTREQIIWRLGICTDDCVPDGKCIICKCPTEKKAFVTQSCNPDRFPDLMNKEDWIKYKLENNIDG